MKEIQTPKGTIQVLESADPDYPGVWIKVNDLEVVLVEYDPTMDKHIIRVWNYDDPFEESEYMQILGGDEE